jgi:HPt (histidine-containing phosphotransfer) domain-containing protein
VSNETGAIVDEAAFSAARTMLGTAFIRIVGYFREDGLKALVVIEDGVRARDAAALVLPAHSLKGESRQFGAEPLAALAEHIEMVARRCVEGHEPPDALIESVVKLRPLFEQTLAFVEKQANPLASRRPAFGRRSRLDTERA